MTRFLKSTLAIVALACTAQAFSDDAYYYLPLQTVNFTEGSIPQLDGSNFNWRDWQRLSYMIPYAVLDGEGEIYVDDENRANDRWPSPASFRDFDNFRVAVRTAAPRNVTGRIFLPKFDASGMVELKFEIPAASADAAQRDAFNRLKIAHYQRLGNLDVPGGAWFRHQAKEAQKALGNKADDRNNNPNLQQPRWDGTGEIERSFELFSGGRAVSENLQLDRILPESRVTDKDTTVAVDSIKGITIKEIDWQKLLKDVHPKLDPLADKVPFDQHVIFFPTFQSAIAMSDQTKDIGGLIFNMAEVHSADSMPMERYQKQLCLSLSTLGRLLGPTAVKSVAVTGSDPYFNTGTDVAVAFEPVDLAVLEPLILAQAAMKAQAMKDAKPISGQIAGVSYKGFRSPDRCVCTYIARLGGIVLVTNSPYQLERFASVAKGETKPIAALDEYKFFRNRYRLGDEDETAFLFLSDATIRRWCGPHWRIANSRRVRDAAVMADLQAAHLDRLVSGNISAGTIYTDLPIAAKGELQLTPAGVVSTAVGSLDFMTPISEISMERVTKAEADSYQRWRDGYERNWNWSFDPIGLRLGVSKEKLSADLSVMPLIWNSEYRRLIDLSRGVKLAADAADPHDTLAQIVWAVNKKSETVQMGEGLARMLTPEIKVDPLSWLGEDVSVFVEDDPFWADLAKVNEKEISKFMENNVGRIPLAFRAGVSDGMKLTLFLAGVHAWIDKTAPGMLTWEPQTYKDQPYVKVAPTERARKTHNIGGSLEVYYIASGDYFLLTLSEPLLKRAIDRQLAQEEAKKNGEPPAKIDRPWLGDSMALRADRKLLEVASAVTLSDYQRLLQRRSWGNLPILNEWKRRYPNEDPVRLHAKFWQTELVCPGGGKYVWNEKWQTMESTVYGHPGEPKEGTSCAAILKSIQRGDFGVTFEEQGLRAKVNLQR
jgi:hypothetical protein